MCFTPDAAAADARASDELARWEANGARGERPSFKPPREREWPLSSLAEVRSRDYHVITA